MHLTDPGIPSSRVLTIGGISHTHIIVVKASKEADIVDHGDAGGEELDGPGQQVVASVAPQS